MNHKNLNWKHDCEGIDWPTVLEPFRLAKLGGREGDKVRRAFERSDLVLFAFDGSTLIGAARALSDFEYHATIYDVVVHPEHQRRAVGSGLMQELLSALPVWRVLLVADAEARPFYQRLGFDLYGDVLAKLDPTRLSDPRGSD